MKYMSIKSSFEQFENVAKLSHLSLLGADRDEGESQRDEMGSLWRHRIVRIAKRPFRHSPTILTTGCRSGEVATAYCRRVVVECREGEVFRADVRMHVHAWFVLARGG